MCGKYLKSISGLNLRRHKVYRKKTIIVPSEVGVTSDSYNHEQSPNFNRVTSGKEYNE